MRRLPIACFVLAAACGKGNDSPARTRPPPLVVVAAVQARDVPVEVRAPVDLRPLAQADVGSKALGYLDAVLVDRGDTVRRGQLVALVRPSDLPDQLAAARGSLAQTRAAVELAKSNLERAQKLAPAGVISQQELQQATTALANALAAQQTAEGQAGAIGARLGETRIESPIDGVVSARRLDPGALVGPPGGGAIVTVVRTDVLRAFVPIPEREIVGVEPGKDAHVELDAIPGRSIAGKVVRVAPALDPGTRTLDAEIQLENRTGELRPGMYGRASIVKAVHAGALSVPVSAVQITAGRRFVYVLAGDKVQRRAVELGVDGGDWLEIVKGVSAGEEVVTAGIDALADGLPVRATRGVNPFTGAASSASGAPAAPAPSASAAPSGR